MRIRIKRGVIVAIVGQPPRACGPGEVLEVEDMVGAQLIRLKKAEPVAEVVAVATVAPAETRKRGD